MNGVGKAGENAFGEKALDMVKTFAGSLGIGMGLAGVIHLVVEEFEAVEKAHKRALEATLPIADAQRMARAFAGFGSVEEAQGFDRKVEAMSAAVGVEQKDLYADAAHAMQERGTLSREKVLAIVQTRRRADAHRRRGPRRVDPPDDGDSRSDRMVRARSAEVVRRTQESGMPLRSIAPMLNALRKKTRSS